MPVRLILTGLGNVGRSFLTILESQRALLCERHDLEVTVVGAADSSGVAFDPRGLDPRAILDLKHRRQGVAGLAGSGHAGLPAGALFDRVEADVLLEATPVDLTTGQPGLDLIVGALTRGMGAVVANKGPIALAYPRLAALSDLGAGGRPALRFSACVGGALPTINLGTRDLAGARIVEVESVLNGTCQGILRAMESGQSFDSAVAEMQRRGIAETDPSLDVDGWDQAVKLVIVANAVLRRPTVLGDVSVTGIRGITSADLAEAHARGQRIVLIGRATRPTPEADWRLTVRPEALPLDHRLARMNGAEMGIVYRTDIAGMLHATSEEDDAVPTAAAMLRDLISITGPGTMTASSSSSPGLPDLTDFATRYTSAWCSQDPNAVAAFFAPQGSLAINGGPPAVGRPAIAASAREFMTAFPDLVVRFDALDRSGGKVVYRWTLIGTNSGPGGTGRSVTISGSEDWRFGADGLVAESLGSFDAADYRRQIDGAAR